MLDKSVSREGLLIMKGGEVFLDGWEVDGAMCREVAILACLYAARRLQEYASSLIATPGSVMVYTDVPDDTPKGWLCEDSQQWRRPSGKQPTAPGGSQPLRELLREARPYLESFTQLSKHPTAGADAGLLIAKICRELTKEAKHGE